jgi:hypothetical protein
LESALFALTLATERGRVLDLPNTSGFLEERELGKKKAGLAT